MPKTTDELLALMDEGGQPNPAPTPAPVQETPAPTTGEPAKVQSLAEAGWDLEKLRQATYKQPPSLADHAGQLEQMQIDQQTAEAEYARKSALVAGIAQQKLDAANKGEHGGGRAPALTPQEQTALNEQAANQKDLTQLNDTAAAESSMPSALKLPAMAAKGAAQAVASTMELAGVAPSDLSTDALTQQPDVGGEGGKFTKDISQFTAGFIGAGKVMGTLGILKDASAVARVGVQTGLGNALAYDQPNRFSDLVQGLVAEHPEFRNPLTRFLASSPDESQPEIRFKNFLDGLGIGAASEAAFLAFKGLRGMGHAATPAEANAIAAETSQQVEQAQYKAVRDEHAQTADVVTADTPPVAPADAPAASPTEAPKAQTDAVAPEPTSGPTSLPRTNSTGRDYVAPQLISSDKAAEIHDAVSQAVASDKPTTGLADILNVDHLPEEVTQGTGRKLVDAVIENIGDALDKATDATAGGHTHPDVLDAAQLLGGDPAQVLLRVRALAKTAKDGDKTLIGAKLVMVDLVNKMAEVSDSINLARRNGAPTAELEHKLLKLMNLEAAVKVDVKGAITGMARGTAAGNIDIAAGMTNTDALEAARFISSADGDPRIILPALKPKTMGQKVLGTLIGVRMETMLSSLTSQIANVAGNTWNTAVFPMKTMIGGVLKMDPAIIEQGARTYIGLVKAAEDSANVAYLSFLNGADYLQGHYTPTPVNLTPGYVGTLLNGMSRFLPSRLMGTADSLFQQLNYRAEVYASAATKGSRAGLTGDSLKDFVNTTASAAFDEAGKATDPEALRYSQAATFKTPLDYGIAKSLNDAVVEHPALRLVVPFVKTPTNIARQQWAQTPILASFQRQYAEDIAAGGLRQARALGGQVVGGALYTTAIGLAINGMITGGGPRDAEQRQAWQATGKRPYSIKIGDQWVSYRRFDSIGMFLGLTADYAEAAGSMKGTDAESVATAMTAATAANLTSKTYYMGLVEALNAIANPEKTGRWYQRMAASFVPNVKQFSDQFPESRDPYMRDAQTILEAVKRKLPGFSESLPPQRNLFGEKVLLPYGLGPDTMNPFQPSSDKHDPVLNELATFTKGFARPEDKIGNIDLRQIRDAKGQTAYDRLMELMGKVTPMGGKTLKDHLYDYIPSESYQNLTPDQQDYNGSRYARLNRDVGIYKEAARGALLKEDFGGVGAAVRADAVNARAAKSQFGQPTTIQDVLNAATGTPSK